MIMVYDAECAVAGRDVNTRLSGQSVLQGGGQNENSLASSCENNRQPLDRLFLQLHHAWSGQYQLFSQSPALRDKCKLVRRVENL